MHLFFMNPNEWSLGCCNATLHLPWIIASCIIIVQILLLLLLYSPACHQNPGIMTWAVKKIKTRTLLSTAGTATGHNPTTSGEYVPSCGKGSTVSPDIRANLVSVKFRPISKESSFPSFLSNLYPHTLWVRTFICVYCVNSCKSSSIPEAAVWTKFERIKNLFGYKGNV